VLSTRREYFSSIAARRALLTRICTDFEPFAAVVERSKSFAALPGRLMSDGRAENSRRRLDTAVEHLCVVSAAVQQTHCAPTRDQMGMITNLATLKRKVKWRKQKFFVLERGISMTIIILFYLVFS
jgi:hypothetical protein